MQELRGYAVSGAEGLWPSASQLRAVVTGLTPPDGTNQAHKPFRDHIVTTVEVFDNLTGRTTFAIPPPIPD